MLLTSIYNKDTKTEKAWYQSSNVLYSEFVENDTDNCGNLFVTFKNGATYKYKQVQLTPDYLMFKHGGLDGSHGKALNTHIKPKYEFERVEDRDVSTIMTDREETISQLKEEQLNKTYFISGHRDITEEELMLYKSYINKVLSQTPDALFIIGDYHGCDIMIQHFIIDELEVSPNQVTVYHMNHEPMHVHPAITNLVGGFVSDEERDSAMTLNSKHDIAFVRNHNELSGTAQNILRRFLFANNIS
jgi:hypothetical protein